MSKSEAEEMFSTQLRTTFSGEPFQREYIFCKGRKFAFDFAYPALKIALEINGGTWQKRGGHSSGPGILRDYEKYNLAQLDGWLLLLVVPAQVESGEALKLWESAIQIREESPF